MVSVNLLPEAVRLTRRRRQRIRVWTSVVLTTLLLATIPIGLDAAKAARAAAVDRSLTPVQTRLDEVRAALKQAAADCTDLHTQIDRADALRAKRSWGGLLTAIAGRQPAEVWLTRLASKRFEAPPRPSVKASGAAQEDVVVALEGPRGIHLEGFALDHEWLYQFMTNLKQAELFSAVELHSAGREPIGDQDGVHFVLECEW